MAPSKRRKTVQFGAPTEDDSDLPTAHALANAPTSTAWSIRSIPPKHALTLGTICMRVFAHNFQKLNVKTHVWNSVKEQLKLVPATLVPRLSQILRETCPSFLHHPFISAVSIHLTDVDHETI